MYKASTSAQHYLECENCEENPAMFLCKTCPGHLCENCRSEHEQKKITRNHDIISISSNNEDVVELLFCTDHTKKKLECYCDPCGKPVCTECIVQSHNGHAVKSLSVVYNKIKTNMQLKKDEIEKDLIPKYKKLLATEDDKRSSLTKEAEEIENEIKMHTMNMIQIIKTMGKRTMSHLQSEKNRGLQEIDNTKDKIMKTIQRLKQMDSILFAKLQARPSISIFESVDDNGLENLRILPTQPDFGFDHFKPGNITKYIQDNFGMFPNLHQKKAATLRSLIYEPWVS